MNNIRAERVTHAQLPTASVKVLDAYELKDELKARGYRFNRIRASWELNNVSQDKAGVEVSWLKSQGIPVEGVHMKGTLEFEKFTL